MWYLSLIREAVFENFSQLMNMNKLRKDNTSFLASFLFFIISTWQSQAELKRYLESECLCDSQAIIKLHPSLFDIITTSKYI